MHDDPPPGLSTTKAMRAVQTNHRELRSVALILLTLAFLLLTAVLGRQTGDGQKEAENPFGGDPQKLKQAAAEGHDLFLLSCAYCHGVDARGAGRGPDLTTGRWTHGAKDAELFRTISHGVPGTDMPACNCEEQEAWKLVSFVRSLSTNVADRPAPNEDIIAAGRKIFFGAAACSACHIAEGRGGRFGPDLTRIGAARPARHLTESIREPDKEILPGYETVTVVTRDGRRVTGVRKNEDTFSVQIMDRAEKFHLYLKKDLREVVPEKRSTMPAYPTGALGEKELQDLLAYLDSLRGPRKSRSLEGEKAVAH